MKNKKEDFGDELAERFLNFAVRIIKLSAALPETPAGKHIANQLLRCEFRRKLPPIPEITLPLIPSSNSLVDSNTKVAGLRQLFA